MTISVVHVSKEQSAAVVEAILVALAMAEDRNGLRNPLRVDPADLTKRLELLLSSLTGHAVVLFGPRG